MRSGKICTGKCCMYKVTMQMPCATLHCGSQCLTNSTITLWMHAKPDGGASNSLAKGQQCVAEHGEAYDCATDQHQAHHWQTFRNAASQLKIKQSRLFKDERFHNLAKQILHSRLEGGGGGGEQHCRCQLTPGVGRLRLGDSRPKEGVFVQGCHYCL